MTTRPSLLRSIPFWLLVVGSVAISAVGAWILTGRIGTMTTSLTDGSATPADVYVGQVVAIFGGILVATGLIGLALAAVVGVVRSFVPAQVVEFVEPIDWTEEDEALAAEAASAEAAVAAEPATDEPTEVVSAR